MGNTNRLDYVPADNIRPKSNAVNQNSCVHYVSVLYSNIKFVFQGDGMHVATKARFTLIDKPIPGNKKKQ